jgi:hypothetical protein
VQVCGGSTNPLHKRSFANVKDTSGKVKSEAQFKGPSIKAYKELGRPWVPSMTSEVLLPQRSLWCRFSSIYGDSMSGILTRCEDLMEDLWESFVNSCCPEDRCRGVH